MAEDLKNWRKHARNFQQSYCDYLGDRFYDRVNGDQLALKVGFALYNAPSDVDENNKTAVYNKAQQNHIKIICDKIKSLQPSEDGLLYIACVYVIFRLRNKKNDIGVQALFRIPMFENGEIKENIHKFVDQKPRIYDSWDQYLKKNKLPKCDMCFPRNGVYTATDGMVDIAFVNSPACKSSTALFNSLDVSSTVLLVGATGVALVSLAVPIAVPVVWGATATVLATGSYETARTFYRLHDINKHGESLSLKNPDARSAWLNLAGSIVGMASIGTTAVVKSVVATESAISRAGILTLRILNASSLGVSGIGVLNGIVTLVMKHINGCLETKDILSFTCACLFFLDAIVSFNVARRLIEGLAGSDMNNLFNMRVNSPFKFIKVVTEFMDENSVHSLQQLITGVNSKFCPDINIDDLNSMVLRTFVLILKLSSGKNDWEHFSKEIISIFQNIWERYQKVILGVIEEIKSTFHTTYWQTLLPNQKASNLEIPRLMCAEINRVVSFCGISGNSNKQGTLMTFARAFSTANKDCSDNEIINRFKFYCDCIVAQYKEEKEIYVNSFDCKSEEADINKADFDKSFGICGEKEDFFLSKAIDKVNHPDFLGNIDELYENLPHTASFQVLDTELPFLQTTKSRIYSFCGPLHKTDLQEAFYWDTASEFTGFEVNNTNCKIHRKDNLVLIQPKTDQTINSDLEAILINTLFINQCHMGLLLVILK